MNIFFLSPLERIEEWRNFRNSLSELSEHEQLVKLSEWFSHAPMNTFYLDWDEYNNWPTPWEIFHSGDYCRTTISYLMERTLVLSGWDPQRIKLIFIKNDTIKDIGVSLLIDNKHLLNYSFGSIYEFDKIKNDCSIIECISYDQNNASYVKTHI